MVYAGFAFDAAASLAALVAIVLAMKAYRVAVRSYEVAERNHSKMAELELLRALASHYDEMVQDIDERSPAIPFLPMGVGVKLAALPSKDLPVWRMIWGYSHGGWDGSKDQILTHPTVGPMLSSHHDEDIHMSICEVLGAELQDAIRVRSL